MVLKDLHSLGKGAVTGPEGTSVSALMSVGLAKYLRALGKRPLGSNELLAAVALLPGSIHKVSLIPFPQHYQHHKSIPTPQPPLPPLIPVIIINTAAAAATTDL
jgi:hypothetical protein